MNKAHKPLTPVLINDENFMLHVDTYKNNGGLALIAVPDNDENTTLVLTHNVPELQLQKNEFVIKPEYYEILRDNALRTGMFKEMHRLFTAINSLAPESRPKDLEAHMYTASVFALDPSSDFTDTPEAIYQHIMSAISGEGTKAPSYTNISEKQEAEEDKEDGDALFSSAMLDYEYVVSLEVTDIEDLTNKLLAYSKENPAIPDVSSDEKNRLSSVMNAIKDLAFDADQIQYFSDLIESLESGKHFDKLNAIADNLLPDVPAWLDTRSKLRDFVDGLMHAEIALMSTLEAVVVASPSDEIRSRSLNAVRDFNQSLHAMQDLCALMATTRDWTIAQAKGAKEKADFIKTLEESDFNMRKAIAYIATRDLPPELLDLIKEKVKDVDGPMPSKIMDLLPNQIQEFLKNPEK